jgi:UDP-N-acetylmuramoyl-L-alanyl-D-glutamate--2,6-diaminopimelate ligase
MTFDANIILSVGPQMELAGLKKLFSESDKSSGLGCASFRVCSDSRQVRPGDTFVALTGSCVDGHDYISQAIDQGARYIVLEKRKSLPDGVEEICVENSAFALAELASLQYDLASLGMRSLAVTGTNGKTTVAYLTRAIVQAAGKKCGLLGTIEYDLGNELIPAAHTTPDALQLCEYISRMAGNGLDHLVMECSSHGLDQDRCSAIPFSAAAFTNLSGDHLDYHGNRQAYLEAKSKLFRQLSLESIAILNHHAAESEWLGQNISCQCWRYGFDRDLDIHAQVQEMGLAGSIWQLNIFGESHLVRSPMIGRFNIANSLAAAGLARAVGIDAAVIAHAFETFGGVEGRLERIEAGQEFSVLVDYAHTDDALKNVLHTLSQLDPKRIILVFGCGGDRDRSKRARMARVAQEYADRIILTNDNPRFEMPEQIFADIQSGFFPDNKTTLIEEPDRTCAIEKALNMAEKGDVVLITGKGHESTQEVRGVRSPLDDRVIARQILGQSADRRSTEKATLCR